MSKSKSEITPDEIRSIRERLGLTQVEAGELIGGGPRAFTKYEAGTVTPAAAVVNLLRILQADPRTMAILKGGDTRPKASGVISPFEVTHEHISALKERTFPELLHKLLWAEAHAYNLPRPRIHVPSSIHTPDGGEDGRITWSDGPDHTLFLPSRLSQFQMKARSVSPSKLAKEVLTRCGTVKDMVGSVLDEGGHHIVLCTHPYTQKQLEKRMACIRQALRNSGLTIDDEQIEVRDADQIASWVNHHPSVATWVKELTRPGTIGPFRSWNHWAGRHAQSPWVEDERLPLLRDRLLEDMTEPRKVVRIVGLSGVGKSRLVLEALRPEEGSSDLFLSDIAMYAVQSEVSSESINRVVQNLVDSGQRAVVVVDDCDPKTHQALTGMVLRRDSRLSLITIDHEIPSGTLDGATLKVDEAPTSVIEGIVGHIAPDLQPTDQRRLVHFSRGFPKIATNIAQAWFRQTPIAHATDEQVVNAFVLGRSSQESELLLKSARLLAAFGPIRIEPSAGSQLTEVARLRRNLSVEDLHDAIVDLVNRGIALRRGGFVVLQPLPIAMRLAERQWKEWNAERRDELLAGKTSPDLGILAARQLALLNETEVSREVVDHVCRVGGPFEDPDGLFDPYRAEVLRHLADISPERVMNQIERSLEDVSDLRQVQGAVQRHLVRALEKIAFHSDTFEDGAHLLLRLAAAESKIWGHNADVGAAGMFKKLFPLFLGSTSADGKARLLLLTEVSDTDDPVRRALVVEALLAGCELGFFSRTVGPEVQGSRPALEPWYPATGKDVTDYVKGCVNLLVHFAQGRDELGDMARSGLSQKLAPLIQRGFIDTVEAVVHQVTDAVGCWSQALRGLMALLSDHRHDFNDEVLARVQKLISKLKPTSLESRVRLTVTEPPLPDPGNEDLAFAARHQREVERVRALAGELLQQPATLAACLPRLSSGRQVLAAELGVAIADLADSPLEWLEPMVQALVATTEGKRNYDLLSGFVAGIAKHYPDLVDAFKERAALSPELAPALPRICLRLGIVPSDIQLAIDALQAGSIPPQSLNRWALHGAFDDVPPTAVASLLDAMLDHNTEAFAEAILLMGAYSFGAPEKLEDLLPQILKLAGYATQWGPTVPHQTGDPSRDPSMYQYHFEKIVNHMLAKGREDPDARATALALARGLAKVEGLDDDLLTKPVLSKLLSSFTEISWPLIGQAIVSNRRRAMLFEAILGDPYTFGREPNPVILHLPEDTLFAWCHAHPDLAPAFAAQIVPVLSTKQVDAELSLHPVMDRLLDEFGERDDVREAIESNVPPFGWFGSETAHFRLYLELFKKLADHPKYKLKLRRWIRKMKRNLRDSIKDATTRDQERGAPWEV